MVTHFKFRVQLMRPDLQQRNVGFTDSVIKEFEMMAGPQPHRHFQTIFFKRLPLKGGGEALQ